MWPIVSASLGVATLSIIAVAVIGVGPDATPTLVSVLGFLSSIMVGLFAAGKAHSAAVSSAKIEKTVNNGKLAKSVAHEIAKNGEDHGR